jgi:hypothetical protein
VGPVSGITLRICNPPKNAQLALPIHEAVKLLDGIATGGGRTQALANHHRTVLGVGMILLQAGMRSKNHGFGAEQLYNCFSDWHGHTKEKRCLYKWFFVPWTIQVPQPTVHAESGFILLSTKTFLRPSHRLIVLSSDHNSVLFGTLQRELDHLQLNDDAVDGDGQLG